MPKEWELGDGELQSVHTPFTTRARELMELYNGLATPLLAVDERLDVLLNVKWTVQEFDCPLSRDIVELCDREADLLNRGRSASSVDGLRKRILNLFLQFIETPDFNPSRSASRWQRGHVAIARDARRATARLGLTRPTGLLHRHYPQVPELQLQNATLISK